MRRETLGLGAAHAACEQLGLRLGGRLAVHQRLALREAVGEQGMLMIEMAVRRVDHGDEVHRRPLGPLMQALEVRVLRIGPGWPQITGTVVDATAAPSRSTDLPLLSISTCCRCAGNSSRCWWYGAMQTLRAPKMFALRMPINASRTGMLCSSGASRKCASIAAAPASSSRKRAMPHDNAIGSPMADHSE